ncbi:uncharacterized protein LOC5503881 [Nematostella vectensis]|uniref:uncharacterized protein LOC5503881 n=1 Tax=Nematostella vectensis TaxID=45351 RepID=UPI0020772B7C|nr:uncharacterized protein LOC5503881 [Nematostella vectensis]
MLLVSAVRFGRTHQVRLLLKAGINTENRDDRGRTALVYCCFLKNPQTRQTILKLLLASGAKVNKRDHLGRSALLWACLQGLVDVVTSLVNDSQSEVDLNLTDNDGNTSLLLAVKSGNLEMVRLLLRLLRRSLSNNTTSFIHRCNNRGISPLLAAFLRGDKDCARVLVQGGAQVSCVVWYLKDCVAESEIQELSGSQEAVFSFLGKSRDPRYHAEILTNKGILEFLFSDDEKITSKQRKITLRIQCDFEHLKDKRSGSFSSTKATIGPKSLTTQSLLAGNESLSIDADIESCCSESRQEVDSALATKCMGELKIMDYSSTQDSVLKLYDIYTDQLCTSYRVGMPICRYKTPPPLPPPPPPLRKESSKSTRSPKVSLQHHSGSDVTRYLSTKRGSGSSGTGLPYMQESAFDRQMRLKYARSSRAASMQVGKLPAIGHAGKKLKRTKSSVTITLR